MEDLDLHCEVGIALDALEGAYGPRNLHLVANNIVHQQVEVEHPGPWTSQSRP